ncbi:tetratricopeptide repeat protein, partial [Candidatus Sumerlaeota bacterium]|nr:tetratricopeptide repeat protein [Candidatus Sumerlaeota bacterium]
MALLPQDLTDKLRKAVDPEALLRKINYRTETIQAAGQTIKSFCPIHKDQIFRTFVVERDHWSYKCTNKQCAGAAGGDLIDLYAKCRGLNYEEAIMEMAKLFGVEIDAKVIADYLKHAQEIGDNFREMGVYAEAEQQYERVLRIQPNSIHALRGLLTVYKELGKAEKQTQTMIRLAKGLVETNEFQEAAALMEEYVRYNPEDTATRMLYISCLEKTGKKDEVAREYVELAEAKTAVGDIDEALALYRRVEAMRVEGLDVSNQIIQILISAGRQDEAVNEMLLRAKVLLRMGVPLGAIRCLQAALNIDPGREDVRLRMAEIIAHEKLFGEPLNHLFTMIEGMIHGQSHGSASQVLERLSGAFPDHPRVMELKGDLEEARGHEELALEIRLKCIELYERRKEFDRALQTLEKALLFQPDQVALLSKRAGLYAELGRYDEAARAYLDIIHNFEQAGEFEQAAVAYQAVIDFQPNEIIHRQRQFDLYFRTGQEPMILSKAQELARAYLTRSEPAKAATCLERVLGIVSENPDLLTLHGEALESLNRRGEASEQYLAAAKLLLTHHQLDEARAKLDRSLKCLPEHMESRELRADVLNEQQQVTQAIGEYEQLAQFYLRAGEAKNLIRVAMKILSLAQDNLETLQLLAAAYGMTGETEQQRATQMRMVWLYRQKQSFTPASELCEEILAEDESYTPAIEQMLAIAESTR